MLWLGAALLAAALWGLSYAAVEHVLKGGVSTFALLALHCVLGLPVFGAIALYDNSLRRALSLARQNPSFLLWTVVAIITYAVGNILTLWAVKQRNATAVSFVEISYPMFVALFSFLIFQANHLTFGTLLGGVLIFTGVVVMYGAG